MFQFRLKSLFFSLSLLYTTLLSAQHQAVGSGGYTTSFPGTDVAGRNTYPSGTPFTIGEAAQKAVPTNDWWSAKIKNKHASNLFNYPFTLKTVNKGLVVTYIPWGLIDNIEPIIVGVTGLNSDTAHVSDFSDWTLSMHWRNSGHGMTATSGIGMPFVYFTKDSADVAEITVNQGTVTISNEILLIENARNAADFAVYAPTGSVWTQNGSTYTSTLNGKNYWSIAFIPLTASNFSTMADTYQDYAYVFPTNSSVNWNYDSSTSVVTTDFKVETEVKEGTDSSMLLGLLPHQWDNLSAASPTPNGEEYETVRGTLKTLIGNEFSVSNTFYGIVPTLPYLDHYSKGFNPAELSDKINALKNDQLNPWTDSYNEGQMMNRLIQTARIADLMGDSSSVTTILETVKERLEDWLKSEAGEKAFLFYYNEDWTTLIGYPAGHGQDGNINDHHFHWGYFIHAAAFLEQFEPGWSSNWGEMVNLLVRDAASSNRNDSLFPFLRNFSPYAGHCWANGFASFPQGNDQESTSESMQFNSALIHWGSITNNKAIRDLGIYLYTTEQTAIEEYWLDQNERNFKPTQQYSLVSRVWGNSYDNGTFWTNDIAASYGIEMYPIHGGSLYLGHDTSYVSKLWKEVESNTGILNNEVNPNLWHDVKWKYLSFLNPQKAIDLYDSFPDRELKFGVSDAHTYHWLHAMNALGIVDASTTANHPIAAVFIKDSVRTYVAHNYGSDSLSVNFSDGYVLKLGPHDMVTSRDISIQGELSTDYTSLYPGGTIPLRLTTSGGTPSKIEFLKDGNWIAQDTSMPYEINTRVNAGKHQFYARIYEGEEYNLSNILTITAGEQISYFGDPFSIDNSIQAGNYDVFEGGIGAGICYEDVDRENKGNFRLEESVDASVDANEGNVVGWIAKGEWLEYTLEIDSAGFYNLAIRYASDNSNGGGPLHLLLGKDTIRSTSNFNSTGGWSSWQTKNVNFVPLKSGVQVLRILFEEGEINLGKLTFTYSSPLPYSQPIADAGENQLIVLPQDTALLDGSKSIDPSAGNLNYTWKQLYGPSVLTFSSDTAAKPKVSGLVEGIYLIRLDVDNGIHSDDDYTYIISSSTNNVAPKVTLQSPRDQSSFLEYDTISIRAIASDLNGTVEKVDFFVDSIKIASDSSAPFESKWLATAGSHTLYAIATDNDTASNSSSLVHIQVNPAPPCKDSSSNKEFLYEFSTDKNNPTITFIPTLSGMGSPTCILYYGTSTTGPFPGYTVSPNTPFRITANQGTRIYFYYTYSYPRQGQHNNSANKDSYVIGSCNVTTSIKEAQFSNQPLIKYYPNPVNDILTLELPSENASMQVYDVKGSLLDDIQIKERKYTYDMASFTPGVYFIRIQNDQEIETIKVIR